MNSLKLDLMKMAQIPKHAAATSIPEKKDAPRGTGLTFEELLESSMKSVNTLQRESNTMVNRMATGDVDDISEVVLASQRAGIALRMIMEVRNKLVDAYQQLGRMQA